MNTQEPFKVSEEGPDLNTQLRIIGIELAFNPNQGMGEIELEMFSCKHTIPNASRQPWLGQRARITIHTSDGDMTINLNRGIIPGNYVV